MTDKKINEIESINENIVNQNVLLLLSVFNTTTNEYENKKIDLETLKTLVKTDIPAVTNNSFLGEEHLNKRADIILTPQSPKFQYIQPLQQLTVKLPTPQGSDFFRLRSLEGTHALTIRDHEDNQLFLLGNSVNNGASNQTRLLADLHYINTEWVVNLF